MATTIEQLEERLTQLEIIVNSLSTTKLFLRDVY